MICKVSPKLMERMREELRETGRTPPGEDELTASLYAAEAGITKRQAYDTLEKLVQAGKMTKRKNGVHDGHKCVVYKFVE